MFSMYISVVEDADDIKTFVGTWGDDEPMDALCERIHKELGFYPDGIFSDVGSTPLYHSPNIEGEEYRVCLTYNTFCLIVKHDDERGSDIHDMLTKLRAERLETPTNIISADTFNNMIEVRKFDEVNHDNFTYARQLHDFHCLCNCVKV